jgi:glyoxylase-like metal-dependent hydrolase (beta-lactamase superfamily II)
MLRYELLPEALTGSNCYLLRDEATNALALTDCGAYHPCVAAAIEKSGGDLQYLLLTHGHFDHIDGAAAVKNAYPAVKIAIGANDAPYLRGEIGTFRAAPQKKRVHPAPDILFEDGDTLLLGQSVLEVLATPGHTPGGVSLFYRFPVPIGETLGLLLTGDTLFFEQVGRDDLPGGDWATELRSLKRLLALPGDYTVLPGHGRATTLAYERQHNRDLSTFL